MQFSIREGVIPPSPFLLRFVTYPIALFKTYFIQKHLPNPAPVKFLVILGTIPPPSLILGVEVKRIPLVPAHVRVPMRVVKVLSRLRMRGEGIRDAIVASPHSKVKPTSAIIAFSVVPAVLAMWTCPVMTAGRWPPGAAAATTSFGPVNRLLNCLKSRPAENAVAKTTALNSGCKRCNPRVLAISAGVSDNTGNSVRNGSNSSLQTTDRSPARGILRAVGVMAHAA